MKDTSQTEQIREKILEMVTAAKGQRQNPNMVMNGLSAEFEVSLLKVKEALNDLVRERKLVFTYRHPFTYVEIPCKDRPSGSRPMKVIVDDQGDPWICDCDVDPSKDFAQQGCWQVREEDYSRSD
jgi:hypothetical protein